MIVKQRVGNTVEEFPLADADALLIMAIRDLTDAIKWLGNKK